MSVVLGASGTAPLLGCGLMAVSHCQMAARWHQSLERQPLAVAAVGGDYIARAGS
eukprot:SAG11_NODE_296_length_11092_cov_24.402620_1_plen_55_part_00